MLALSQIYSLCSITADRAEKTCQRRQLSWGTFWMTGEHFPPKFTLLSRILQFVKIKHFYHKFNYKNLNFVTRKDIFGSLVVKKAKKKIPKLPWF